MVWLVHDLCGSILVDSEEKRLSRLRIDVMCVCVTTYRM